MNNKDTKRALAIIMAVILFCLNIPENTLIMLADNMRQQEIEKDSQLEIVHLTMSAELLDGTKYESGTWTNEDVTVYIETTPTDAETTSTDIEMTPTDTETTSTDANIYKVVTAATDTDVASALELNYDSSGKYFYKVECEENKIINQEQYFWAIDNNGNRVSESKNMIINIDKAAPKITKIEYEIIDGLRNKCFAGRYSGLNNTLEKLVFLLFKDCIYISIDAEDVGSGIKTIQYKAGENWEPLLVQNTKTITLDENKNNYSFFVDISSLIEENKESTLFFKVTDNVGNDSEESVLNNVILAKNEDIRVMAEMKTGEEVYTSDKWTKEDVVITLGTYYQKAFSLSPINDPYQYMVNKEGQTGWQELEKGKNEYPVKAEDDKVINDTYYFINSSIDDKNKTNTKSKGYSVKIDRAKPEVSELTLEDDNKNKIEGWYNNNVKITGTASDEGAGIEKVVYKYVAYDENNHAEKPKYDNSDNDFLEANIIETENNLKTFSVNIPLQNSEEIYGKYYIYAVDGVKNVSEAKEIEIQLSNKKPTITNITAYEEGDEKKELKSGTWTKKDIYFLIEANSGLSGIDRIVSSTNSNLEQDDIKALEKKAEPEGENLYKFKVSVPNGKVLEDNNTYYFWAIDKAGNISKISDEFLVKIDKKEPEIGNVSFISFDNQSEENIFAGRFKGSIINNNSIDYLVFKDCIKVNIEIKDEGSGVDKLGFTYQLTDKNGNTTEDRDVQNYIESNGNGYAVIILDSKEKDVISTISLKAVDNAGNSTQPKKVEMNKQVILSSEENVKVKAKFCLVEDENTIYEKGWTNKDIKVDLGTYYIGENEDYRLTTDEKGNENYIYSKLQDDIENKLKHSSYEINVAEGDVLDQIYFYKNISLIHSDNTISDEYHIQIDKKKPEIEKELFAENGDNQNITSWYKKDITIKGIAKDEDSGIEKIVYKYVEYNEDGEISAVPDYLKDKDFIEIAKPKEPEKGIHEFEFEIPAKPNKNGKYYIYAIDIAGNISDVSEIEIQLDNVAPQLDKTVYKNVTDKNGMIRTFNNQTAAEWDGDGDKLLISGIAQDKLSGVSEVAYRYVPLNTEEDIIYDKEKVLLAEFDNQSGRYQFLISNPDEQGQEVNLNGIYYIWAIDYAENVSKAETIEIKYDNTIPEISEVKKEVKDSAGNIKNNQEDAEWDGNGDILTISGIGEDNLSGVSKVVYKYIEEGEDIPTAEEVKRLENTAELGLSNPSGETEEMLQYQYSISIPNEILNEAGERIPNNLDGMYYIWAIDMAGNVSNNNTIHIKLDNTAPDNLAMNIDSKDSEGNDKIDKIDIHNIGDAILYKHFYNTEIYISLFATDNEKNASEIKTIEYQKVLKGEPYQEDSQWTVYTNPIPIEIINDQFIIYFKVTDYAGNQTIKAGDGIVVDDKSPVGSDYAKPEITIKPQPANSNGYYGLEYGASIYVDVDVSDPPYIGEDLNEDAEKGYFSGIHSISYKIVTDGNITESKEGFYSFDGNYEILEQKKQVRIEIPTAVNNSNNVILSITAIDNAGNIKTTETKLGDIKIDVTHPTIDIVYDNNSPLNERYYGNDRTATITITERNFSPEDVTVNISNSYGEIPVISSWFDVQGNGNGDNTKHQAKITWHADGDYQFNISYKDLAGNQDTGMNFASGTQNSTRFIIDQTNPEISISYNNNTPLNEVYYNSDRIATITITEQNFNPEEVVVNISNPYGNVPTISNWATSGLNHTATITYSEDGDYTFSIGYADLAGNKNNMETYSADSRNTNFFILDKTVPEIFVSYNNNNPSEERYYNTDRTATVRIVERNFKGEEVITEIQNTDGIIPQISEWGRDNITNLSSITYAADGDYTFNMRYTDLAGNIAGAVQYEDGTVNSSEFTIDQTAPVVTVSYNNNTSSNSKYFNVGRTATITVEEHNFNPADITYTQTAVKKGGTVDIPAVSSWTDNGDIHTASINYNADGDYTFDMSMTDMSGNPNDGINYTSVAAQDFTVDSFIDEIKITGIENGTPYRGEVKPKITFSDINLNGEYKVTLTRTKKDIINEDVTEQFIGDLLKRNGDEISGEIDTFNEKDQEGKYKRENDGIYTLYVGYQDLAGNQKENTVVFSINRFGSVYVLSEDLINLKNTYTQKAEGNLVITEYNPDKLVENSLNVEITKDGQPLEKEALYTVTPEINEYVSIGESGWYQYAYTISEENFEKDGVYKVIVSSQDKAGNQPETTRDEESKVIFTIDTIAPEITNITGLENEVVNATEINADYEVFDSIGLKYVQVYIDDKEVLKQDKFDDFTIDKGSFTITTGANQHIRLVATDLAGNIIDTDSDQFNPAYQFKNDITVSTNFFVRWYAQKTLFYGSIIGFALIVGSITIFIIWKKSKKHENAPE